MPGWGKRKRNNSDDSKPKSVGPDVNSTEDFPDLLGGGGGGSAKTPTQQQQKQEMAQPQPAYTTAGKTATPDVKKKTSSPHSTATTTATTTAGPDKRNAENMNGKEVGWEMMVAADTGDVERLKYLIETCDADPNHTHRQGSSSGYNKGSTSIMYAARSGHLDAVDYLLSRKADPHAVEDELWNCLHYSCFNGHAAITARFLELKVNTELITMFEKATPLGFATHRRFARVAPLFKGSPVAAKQSIDVTPFTEPEAQEVLDRGKKKLAKGRRNKATAGKFLFRYEIRDDAFAMISSFLEKASSPRIVQISAFDHVAQCNVLMRMFKSWEDRDTFVEMEKTKKSIIRSGSVSGMQHIVVWRVENSAGEDLTPQAVQN